MYSYNSSRLIDLPKHLNTQIVVSEQQHQKPLNGPGEHCREKKQEAK
jgi:hypothetical protein